MTIALVTDTLTNVTRHITLLQVLMQINADYKLRGKSAKDVEQERRIPHVEIHHVDILIGGSPLLTPQ